MSEIQAIYVTPVFHLTFFTQILPSTHAQTLEADISHQEHSLDSFVYFWAHLLAKLMAVRFICEGTSNLLV